MRSLAGCAIVCTNRRANQKHGGRWLTTHVVSLNFSFKGEVWSQFRS